MTNLMTPRYLVIADYPYSPKNTCVSLLDLHTDEAPISYIKREFIKQFPKYE